MFLLTELLSQGKTSFYYVNNMVSSDLRKMLALINCQHPSCFGLDVCYEHPVGHHYW